MKQKLPTPILDTYGGREEWTITLPANLWGVAIKE